MDVCALTGCFLIHHPENQGLTEKFAVGQLIFPLWTPPTSNIVFLHFKSDIHARNGKFHMARLNTKTLRAELAYFHQYMREDGAYDHAAETAILRELCQSLGASEESLAQSVEITRGLLPQLLE